MYNVPNSTPATASKTSTLNNQPSTDFVYDYFLKDHFGNIRMVLTDYHIQQTYPAATLEDTAVETENDFYNIKTGNILPLRVLAERSTKVSPLHGVITCNRFDCEWS